MLQPLARCCRLPPADKDRSMAAKTSWAAFPHDAKGFAYAGDALKKAWPKLHAGDCEPFPDAKRAAALLEGRRQGGAERLDADALAAALQDAWRAFHRGDFKAAFDAGEELGPVGASVAVKAHRHPRHLSGRQRRRKAQALRAGRQARRSRGQGAARRSQQPLPPRLRAGPLQPGPEHRQGAEAGHRRQGARRARHHAGTRAQARRGAHRDGAVPRRDHRQDRRDDRRPDLRRQGRPKPKSTSRPRSS